MCSHDSNLHFKNSLMDFGVRFGPAQSMNYHFPTGHTGDFYSIRPLLELLNLEKLLIMVPHVLFLTTGGYTKSRVNTASPIINLKQISTLFNESLFHKILLILKSVHIHHKV